VVSGVTAGSLRVTIEAQGFKVTQQELDFQASKPARMGTTLAIGGITETVTVTDGASQSKDNRQIEELARRTQAAQLNTLSQNVTNLQRRVAGLLPVPVEVPRSGKSYRFVRPLVLEEDTRITFLYKLR
jgi:hypothetical protein